MSDEEIFHGEMIFLLSSDFLREEKSKSGVEKRSEKKQTWLSRERENSCRRKCVRWKRRKKIVSDEKKHFHCRVSVLAIEGRKIGKRVGVCVIASDFEWNKEWK